MTSLVATWTTPDPARLLAALGEGQAPGSGPGASLRVVSGSTERLDLDERPAGSDPAGVSVGRLLAVGIGTVDADRAADRIIRRPADPAGTSHETTAVPIDDPWLGGRGVAVDAGGGLRLIVLEPTTEGLLAAFLARSGEGAVAAWVVTARAEAHGMVGRSTSRPTALGPVVVVRSGGRWGPYLLGLEGIGPSAEPGATIGP